MKKGSKQTREAKLKMSIARKGVPPPNKGNCYSNEKKEKMSLIMKVVWANADFRKNIEDKARGRKWTEKQRNSIVPNLPRGDKHHRWLKDRNKLAKRQERNDSAYIVWRQQVWLRDNFKCRISNTDCTGKKEAHHILGWSEYPELRYQINNGITLCHAHHPRKRAEEKRLSPYFQSLVSASKKLI